MSVGEPDDAQSPSPEPDRAAGVDPLIVGPSVGENRVHGPKELHVHGPLALEVKDP